jgi:PAS domain-containing protein
MKHQGQDINQHKLLHSLSLTGMDELLRISDLIRNVDALHKLYLDSEAKNEMYSSDLQQMSKEIKGLEARNESLINHIELLESVLNSLQLIVSIRDMQRNSLLWYNANFLNILGYRHKELQTLISVTPEGLIYPEDLKKNVQRTHYLNTHPGINHYSTIIRLKHKDGNWLTFNSLWHVLKRNDDRSVALVLELLSEISAMNTSN